MTRNQRRQIRKEILSGRSIRCRTPEELQKVQAALVGLAVHLRIEHDDACSPIACRCQPHYVVQLLTVEAAQRGADLEREWRRNAIN